jgi:CMP/dCMP kinase
MAMLTPHEAAHPATPPTHSPAASADPRRGATRRSGGGPPRTIAVDGPVASGKTAVGRRLAESLGYLMVDTGLLYRGLAWLAVREGVRIDDGPALAALVERHDLGVMPDRSGGAAFQIRVDGSDVTAQLATAAVDAVVSPVSAQPEVRAALLVPQRRIAACQAVVMVGRDIGTVVLPDADLKIFLTASAATRARRRFRERLARGETARYADILAALVARDEYDSRRAVAPLAAAADAVLVDTDACDLAQVVAHLLALAARWPDALTTGGGASPCRPQGGSAVEVGPVASVPPDDSSGRS